MKIRTLSTLTDFGDEDGAHNSMAGLAKRINQDSGIIVEYLPISQHVPEFDIVAGILLLEANYKYWPDNAVFIVVVDPGVGTDRKLLLIETGRYTFIGPDNGIFSAILDKYPHAQVVSLENDEFWQEEVSSTFEGRDIMASVAGHYISGVPLERFGPKQSRKELVWIDLSCTFKDGTLCTKVIYIDNYGNLVLGVKKSQFAQFVEGTEKKLEIDIRGKLIKRCYPTFYSIPKGKMGLLFGGDFGDYGTIAMNMDNTAEHCGAKIGDPVMIRLK